ncbi:ABC transporter ATP-binding protein [Microbacterium capsulatum]|uniref:ABC transporter ATP-binding protein n=1 Tax=Microbacterium capsulatum TaxID=3041921 RepID=A0ABU0XGS9_9MICO|nr:ABC transporter ATP-binding protein [Microbacterium sp. ASV81]MDQ4214332.1 ABC transporter ATP-binding protein [Microbacterium sp. ASV81]
MGGIVAEGVGRSFGGVHAVRDATFHAAEGRITGLVGPNGAGKTTLLLMLASLLAPDRGSIRVADVDPVADPIAARRMLGWMPDALGAWLSLTVRESIVTTARLHDLAPPDADRRAAELLDLVGLEQLASTPAKVLSRGQKQKLGLARALVHDPRILLLDEPASGLDPQARVQLRTLLRRLAEEGRTILISSHVLSELEEVADDTVFLVAGSVVDAPAVRARTWRIRILPEDVPEAGAEVRRSRAAAALGIAEEAVGVDRGDLLLALPDEPAAAEALRRLVAAGIPVIGFAPAQSDLEQAFLALDEGSGR